MKKGSYIGFALRMYAKAVVAGFLAFVMNAVLLAAYESLVLNIFACVVSFILEGLLVYKEAWKQGFSDVNRDKNEKKTPDMYKGLKAGFIASIPVFVITFLLILVKFNVLRESYIAFYRIANTVYQPLSLSFLPSTLTCSELPISSFLVMILTCFTIPFFSFPAYYLGYHDYLITSHLIYRKKPAKVKL